jgi:hypothetical protein
MPHSRQHAGLPALLAASLALALGGCAHREQDHLTQAVESGERPVAMAGSEPFFGGKIVVRVTLARGIGHGYKREKETLTRANRGFDATRELAEQDRANAEEARAAYEDYARAKAYIGVPLPPVTLHLILINTGDQPITPIVTDFDSDLGNFVVYPDTLVVPAGQTAEPTAMVSQLGVSSDEIPVTVTMRLGKAKETHVVVLKNLLDESGKPKAAAPAGR